MTVRRVMFVTVGTSLFASASWDPAEVPRSEARRYPELTRGERLTTPELRLALAGPRRELEAALDEQNAELWAARLPAPLLAGEPHDRTELGRYGAELSTLLRLAGGEPLRDCLARYRRIFVVGDPVSAARPEERRSWIAAVHLHAYLAAILGDPEPLALLEVPGLASAQADELVSDLSDHGIAGLRHAVERASERQKATRVDLVVTGGYKLYGYVLAPLVARTSPKTRLLYAHETARDLVEINGDQIVVDGIPADLPFVIEGLAP